jgi:hypothetical protein
VGSDETGKGDLTPLDGEPIPVDYELHTDDLGRIHGYVSGPEPEVLQQFLGEVTLTLNDLREWPCLLVRSNGRLIGRE